MSLLDNAVPGKSLRNRLKDRRTQQNAKPSYNAYVKKIPPNAESNEGSSSLIYAPSCEIISGFPVNKQPWIIVGRSSGRFKNSRISDEHSEKAMPPSVAVSNQLWSGRQQICGAIGVKMFRMPRDRKLPRE